MNKKYWCRGCQIIFIVLLVFLMDYTSGTSYQWVFITLLVLEWIHLIFSFVRYLLDGDD